MEALSHGALAQADAATDCVTEACSPACSDCIPLMSIPPIAPFSEVDETALAGKAAPLPLKLEKVWQPAIRASEHDKSQADPHDVAVVSNTATTAATMLRIRIRFQSLR